MSKLFEGKSIHSNYEIIFESYFLANFNTLKVSKFPTVSQERGEGWVFSGDQLGRDQVFKPLNNPLSGIDLNEIIKSLLKIFAKKIVWCLLECNTPLQEVLALVSFT